MKRAAEYDTGWACSWCTFLNKPLHLACDVCGVEKLVAAMEPNPLKPGKNTTAGVIGPHIVEKDAKHQEGDRCEGDSRFKDLAKMNPEEEYGLLNRSLSTAGEQEQQENCSNEEERSDCHQNLALANLKEAETPPTSSRWACGACTFENKTEDNACTICNTKRRPKVAMQPPQKRMKVGIPIAPLFLKNKAPSKSVITLDPNDKENALWVIHDFLSRSETKALSDFMFSMPLIDEAKGDGEHTDAVNQGVIGVYKPSLQWGPESLQPFKQLDDGPCLITNYSSMQSGGDSYRFVRCDRAVGFFVPGWIRGKGMDQPGFVYIKPRGVGGTCVAPQQPPPILMELLSRVSNELDTDMNGIFVNLYPTGATNINSHSDEEGRGHDIASVSVGASRQFVVRRAPQEAHVHYCSTVC